MYLDFFFVFRVQNDKILTEMNKKDKIEARKAIFDCIKYLLNVLLYTQIWSKIMLISIFLRQNIEIKKNIVI